jgi:hypothetical protein
VAVRTGDAIIVPETMAMAGSGTRPPITISGMRADGHAPLLDLRLNMVTSACSPFIELNAQAVLLQPFCDSTNDHLILRAVTQENIVCKIVSHASLLVSRFSSYQGDERHDCQPN